MNGTRRRQTHEAGQVWTKWGDPAYRAIEAYQRRERRWLAVTVWTWAVALGAWAGIIVVLARP